MSIDKEFVPYQESLELKELGFNEDCLCFYNHNGQLIRYMNPDKDWNSVQSQTLKNSKITLPNTYSAPTFSQAFKFFREKYGLYHHIVPEFYTKGINFNWQILWYLPKEEWTKYVISDGTALYGDNGEYPKQEDAELACLRKLIEIVKEKS